MRKVIAMAAVGIALFGACGGSSSKKASSTKAAGSSATTAAGGLSATNIGSFCDFQKASGGSQAAAAAAATPNRADMEKAASQIDKAADFAPAEIRSDMRIFIDGYLKPFYAELARVDYDFTKINFTALSGLSRPDVQAASQRIATYYQTHCAK
jgi:hypothetical protein